MTQDNEKHDHIYNVGWSDKSWLNIKNFKCYKCSYNTFMYDPRLSNFFITMPTCLSSFGHNGLPTIAQNVCKLDCS